MPRTGEDQQTSTVISGLLALTRSLSSARPLEERLNDLCSFAVDLTGCTHSGIFLPDADGYCARYRSGTADAESAWPYPPVHLDDPLIAKAIATRSVAVITDPHHRLLHRTAAQPTQLQTLAVAPLFGEEGPPLGLLVVAYETPAVCGETAMSLLQGLAELGGSTLMAEERARTHRQMQAALRASEQRSRALIENALDLIAVLNGDGTIAYASPSHTRVLGYPTAYLIGKRLPEFVHPDDRVKLVAAAARILVTPGGEALVECRFRHQDGSWRTLEGVGRNLLHDPIIAGVVVNTRDITERKLAAAALRESLRLRENIMETIPDVLYTIDRLGRVVDWNRKLETVTGYAPEEIRGQPAVEFFAPHDWDRLADAISAAFTTGYAEIEADLRLKDGTVRPHHFTGVPLKDDSGEVIGLTGVGRDISERRRVEQALAEEAELSRATARMGSELISSLDRPALLDKLCEVTTAVLGCDCSYTVIRQPEEDVYVTVSGYGYPPEQWEWIKLLKAPTAMLSRFLTPLGEQDVTQFSVSDDDTDPFAVLARDLGIRRALCMALRRGSELIGVHVACSKQQPAPFSALQERIGGRIAQLASMAIENARLLEELTQASQIKTEFVATMSHELRTPLSVIIGYTDLVLDGAFGALTSEQDDSLRRVHQRARELLDLINATLDLSRLEAGRTPLHISEVNLGRLLEELVAELPELQERSDLRFVCQIGADVGPVWTDALKLKVVLKNLIGNAVKFTECGSICVEADRADGGVTVAVTDTGIGIAAPMVSRIFEAFRQVDPSSTRRHGGVGLGLYIVRRLLELLGGTITVDSQLGRGSTFRIWLPAMAAAAAS